MKLKARPQKPIRETKEDHDITIGDLVKEHSLDAIITQNYCWDCDRGGYEIEPYTAKHIENSDRMKTVDMETASGMALFFWNLGLQSIKSSTVSTEENQSPKLTTE